MMTVSRAINGRPGVGPELRLKVLETAASLGYRPSRVARGLASRKTSTLGIVLPDMANPFFAILAKAATDVAREVDKNVFIMNTDEDPALELEALASLAGEAIDGVIVAGSRFPSRHSSRPFRGSTRPCSSIAERGPRDGRHESRRSGRGDRGRRLSRRPGRRRIAFIAGPAASMSGRLRLSGYRSGLKAGGPGRRRRPRRALRPDARGRRVGREVAARPRRLRRRDPRIQRPRGHRRDARPRRGGTLGAGRGRGDRRRRCALRRPRAPRPHHHPSDISELGRCAMSRLLALCNGKELDPPPVFRPELIFRESA